jgi:hypothetical protein
MKVPGAVVDVYIGAGITPRVTRSALVDMISLTFTL